ncbi:hypothetical protein G7Z17_g3648 [Cylindrodendrum hubeiense]|uniref:Protein kinase domain-containing protein n=1 Tax=Cylindrodendrum hubeiense TaxID=595255 RepID=A0A9P5HAD5_9HYPO|nr:hypothetical protein G7Z17_g3648 [Cylindrodendrum hubeiense]
MSIQSNRSRTILNNDHIASLRLRTIKDFCEVLQSRHVQRVTLNSYNDYRSRVLSNRGSQFVVYAGDGVELFGQPPVVIKCAKVFLSNDSLPHKQGAAQVASALYREIAVLTHPQLREQENIIRLLWYDFVEENTNAFVPALVVERAKFGSLASFLDTKGFTLDEAAKIHISVGVTAGLLAFHHTSIVHGDVKTENILARWADLDSVISTLQGVQTDPRVGSKAGFPVPQERKLVQVFADASYFDFTLDVELEAERGIQADVFSNLQRNSRSSDATITGKALFELALASSIGFGTACSLDKTLDYAIQSAKKGYLPAMAVVILPARIISPDFIASIAIQSNNDLDELARLAAIHGASHLMKHLLQVCNVDSNLTNNWGESLLLLCCKAGHLNVLRILVDGGAKVAHRSGSASQRTESPLHWLIAFEDDQIEQAARILERAGGDFDSSANMTWNHPSIDLPGRFPIGSPFQYAAFFNNAACVKAYIDLLRIPANWPGCSELTPFEFGFSRRKLQFSRAMVAKVCLNDVDENSQALLEFAGLLKYESWIAAAVDSLSLASHVGACLDFLLEAQPGYLDGTIDGGFTPLMHAVTYRDPIVVEALINRGCDVNSETSREMGQRTALTFVTATKMQHEPDNIVELLLEADAKLDHRSNDSEMQPLHFAVQNDCPLTTQKLIKGGANVNDYSQLIGTPLHRAVYYGSAEATRVLLEAGANPHAEYPLGNMHSRSWDKLTPLAIAATRPHQPLVELLLRYNPGYIARPLSGHSVLHLAIAERDSNMLQKLLSISYFRQKEIVNHQTTMGVTALVLCATNPGRHGHLKMLLGAGADPNIETNSGHTALDVAIQYSESLKSWSDTILQCQRSRDVHLLEDLRGEAYRMLGAIASQDVTAKAIILAEAGSAFEDDVITIFSRLSPSAFEHLEEFEEDSDDKEMEDVGNYSYSAKDGSEPELLGSSASVELQNENNSLGGGCEEVYFDVQAELDFWDSTIRLLNSAGGRRSSRIPFDRHFAGLLDWRPEGIPASYYGGLYNDS